MCLFKDLAGQSQESMATIVLAFADITTASAPCAAESTLLRNSEVFIAWRNLWSAQRAVIRGCVTSQRDVVEGSKVGWNAPRSRIKKRTWSLDSRVSPQHTAVFRMRYATTSDFSQAPLIARCVAWQEAITYKFHLQIATSAVLERRAYRLRPTHFR